jgi:MFS family permease
VTGEGTQPGTYRRLLASAAWRRFTVTAGLQRLSVAMAPLALVLAGHGAIGSFRVGALMASAYTFADGIASPWSGRLIDRMELRRGLSVELGAAAVVLAALAGLAAARAPALVLIALSALAGAAPAGVMGGLRAFLQRIAPEDLRDRAFALDATLLELEWMFAPALVAITGFLGAPVLAIVLMALAAFGALGGARLLSPQPPSERLPGASGAWRSPKACRRLAARDGGTAHRAAIAGQRGRRLRLRGSGQSPARQQRSARKRHAPGPRPLRRSHRERAITYRAGSGDRRLRPVVRAAEHLANACPR